jgi:hypothetical protein
MSKSDALSVGSCNCLLFPSSPLHLSHSLFPHVHKQLGYVRLGTIGWAPPASTGTDKAAPTHEGAAAAPDNLAYVFKMTFESSKN